MIRIILRALFILILMTDVLSACVPHTIEGEETLTLPAYVKTTSSPEILPSNSKTEASTPTNTLKPLDSSATPSPLSSPTPEQIGEGFELTVTSWDGSRSLVHGIRVGCLDDSNPCFGEPELLAEIQDIEIWEARWSPDGKRLAFEGTYRIGDQPVDDIFVVDSGGKNLMNITNVSEIVSGNEFRTIAEAPRWSPDGLILAYNLCNLSCKVFETNIESGMTKQLLEKLDSSHTHLGGWSPTGDQLVFTIDDVHSNSQVFISDLIGDNLIQVTDTLEDNYSASYSPDGNWLLVNRAASAEGLPYFSSLFIIDPSSYQERKLTYEDLFYIQPVWSSDSQWIVTVGETGPGPGQIYLININGTVIQLELEPGKYSNPGWRSSQNP